MRFVVEYTPHSSWFWYMKLDDPIRDMGDYIISFCKIQVTIWVKKPYYHKSYKKYIKEDKEFWRKIEEQR